MFHARLHVWSDNHPLLYHPFLLSLNAHEENCKKVGEAELENLKTKTPATCNGVVGEYVRARYLDCLKTPINRPMSGIFDGRVKFRDFQVHASNLASAKESRNCSGRSALAQNRRLVALAAVPNNCAALWSWVKRHTNCLCASAMTLQSFWLRFPRAAMEVPRWFSEQVCAVEFLQQTCPERARA